MIKRVNLYFNLGRENDRIVYEKINSFDRNMKSAFVIETILNTLTKSEKIDKETIKQALREVLQESQMVNVKAVEEQKSEIPDEVFDILDKL